MKSTKTTLDKIVIRDKKALFLERLTGSNLLTMSSGRLEFKLVTDKDIGLFVQTVRDLICFMDTDIQEKVFSYLEKVRTMRGSLRPFARYFLDSFVSCTEFRDDSDLNGYRSSGLSEEFISGICPFNLRGSTVVDFGFGNFETLLPWKGLGAKVVGFDLSPFFVDDARKAGFESYLVQIDSSNDEKLRRLNVDIVTSTLTLDRVAKPKQLLKNMANSLRIGGFFAIQTLLPVIAVDDGHSVIVPIIYTESMDRISQSSDRNESLRDLIQLIGDNQIGNIKVVRAACRISSLDGIQDYSVCSISGLKLGQL